MTRKVPPSFDFFFNDWLGGTSRMNHVQRACYLALLIDQWQNGHIPLTAEERMRVCGISSPDEWRGIWERIGSKFSPVEIEVNPETPGLYDKTEVLVNLRMFEDRQKSIKRYRASQNNGRKGGRPKKLSAESTEPDKNLGVFSRLTQNKPTGKEEGGRKKEESLGLREDSEFKSSQSGNHSELPGHVTQSLTPKQRAAPTSIRPTAGGSMVTYPGIGDLRIPDVLDPIRPLIDRWVAHCFAHHNVSVFALDQQLIDMKAKGCELTKKAIEISLHNNWKRLVWEEAQKAISSGGFEYEILN